MENLRQALMIALDEIDMLKTQSEDNIISDSITQGIEQNDRIEYNDRISYSGNHYINVETLTSGFILKVGCQSIAVESGVDVAKLIEMYLTDNTIGDKWMNSDKIVQKFIKENLQVK